MIFAISLGLAAAIIATIALQPLYLRYRRAQWGSRPFAADYRTWLMQSWPLYRRMPESVKSTLHQRIQVLLQEKTFYGAGGLQINERMRVLIAAQAAVLLLGSDKGYYPKLRSILVYPESFVVERIHTNEVGVVTKHQQALAGESWDWGKVIVAWRDVEMSAHDSCDGFNVVIHEFAHQLDQETGSANGAPYLMPGQDYATWSEIFQSAFNSLRAAIDSNQAHLLDQYAAGSPAEFFAVASEYFFEQSHALREQYPQVYAQLRHYYGIDPCDWQSMPSA